MIEQSTSTIYVIDDDESFRRSLVFLLESVGWPVSAFDSAEAFLACHPDPPDDMGCMVLDIRMPVMSGLALQQHLHRNGWPLCIVFITGHGDVQMAVQAMKAGCCDFLEKPFKDQALLDAVDQAVQQMHLARKDASLKAQAKALLDKLSPREDEVAKLVALGQPNKQVARELGISEKTVHIHRQHVMEKTGVTGAAGLARLMLTADASALDG
ncbi:response regulator transcription factor [Pusillimonas sp. ANT_WB101]|uniref:response regulator transcription factor n=1 Tax=Pusillimonas sp. ANT_WB101 TaxID=2597356 RepID=UPI0011EDD9F8|nr:response regulator [Pusillimonas sp. ANT_WB101]KAA0910828.1 response regulator transcription factor [Pusillimonas sp. ANT_WB101]